MLYEVITERKKRVDFSQKYLHVPARFAARKGTPLELTAAFMKDKKVGVQRATTMDTYISDNFHEANIKRYGTAEEAYLDLKSGRP